MNLPIFFPSIALKEYREAHEYYLSKSLSTAERFLEAIEVCLLEISSNPERYPIVYFEIHEAILLRFPFAIYYLAGSDRVDILSIFHTSRDPHFWQGRR